MAFSEAIKHRVRKKSHMQCCLCKAIGVEIHHIVPQESGGLDVEDNAAPLCPSCHETYGANPQKRKFIREARDLWYEICEKRYESDQDKLDEIKSLLQKTISFDDFNLFKEELISNLHQNIEFPRGESEIVMAVGEMLDKVWYNRHKVLKYEVESGIEKVDPDIWKGALKSAKKMEKNILKKN